MPWSLCQARRWTASNLKEQEDDYDDWKQKEEGTPRCIIHGHIYVSKNPASQPAPTTLVVFIYEPQSNDITGMNKEMQNASLKHTKL